MKNIILIIIAILFGVAIGIYFGKKRIGASGIDKTNQEKEEIKNERKQKILELLKTKSPVTNNDVQKLLGVSDATAENYLDELEKEGQIRQIGKTGRSVEYELNG